MLCEAATGPPGAPHFRRTRLGGQQKASAAAKPAEAPSAPKVVLPADAPVITIKPPIVVRDLADQLKQKPFKIIADLMESGVFASVNQAIDEKVAQKICAKYGFRFEVEKRERGSGLVHAPSREGGAGCGGQGRGPGAARAGGHDHGPR